MRNKITGLFFMCGALFCFASDALGCGCIMSYGQYQPCGVYWNANVVFSGVAAEVGAMTPVEGSDGKAFTTNGRVTRFKVEEAFRGVSDETVETFEQGTSCDYYFKPGERYFVYGVRNPKDGKVYVSSCSATKPLDRADADIVYARGVAAGEKTPSIVGYVLRETRENAAAYRSNKPLAGIKVIIEGDNDYRKTVFTDNNGTFRAFDLPAGTYRVKAATPAELRLLHGENTEKVQVSDNRCSGAGFTVTSLSTITGKTVDAHGKPFKTRVNLVLVDEQNRELPQAENLVETYTDAEGVYKFDWVAPGRYLVAVNARNQPGRFDPPFPRIYYPGVHEAIEATAINVADGQHYEIKELRLPSPLTERTIEGTVLLPDGRPAAHALVILEFTDRAWSETEGTDEQGHFTLKVYDGFKYLVAGEVRREVQGVWRGTYSLPIEVVAGAAINPLSLTVTQPGFYRPLYAQRKPNK